MAWVNWSRKSATDANHGSLGVELNASRVRATTCKSTRNRIVLLDNPHPDLPMAISLEKRAVEVGRAGVALCRRLPHLSCIAHLPHLGQPQEWKGGRHRLDAAIALALTFDKLRASCVGYDGVFLGLPSYMSMTQVTKLTAIAAKNHFPIKGTVISSMALVADRAAALLSDAQVETETTEEWIVPLRRRGTVLLPIDTIVVDADDHALTANLVRIESGQIRLLATATHPRLSVRTWKDRLLNALSDRCIRACRRDPRDSAEAEQRLYEQMDESLDRLRAGQKIVLTVRSAHWYQDLVLQPEDYEGYCAELVRRSIESIRELMLAGSQSDPPRAVWLTHEAGRLPGLAKAVHHNMAERTSVGVMKPEAVAVAIANLGERWTDEELPRSHLDSAIPIRTPTTERKTLMPSSVKSHR